MPNNKTVNLVEKTYIKANGVTLYQFASSRDASVKYFITAKDGVIDAATHQDCPGYANRGKCYHCDYILQDIPTLATYDVQAAANQVVLDAEIGDAYEHMPKQLPRLTEAEETQRCYRDIAWDDRF